jgi:hypothetical protein
VQKPDKTSDFRVKCARFRQKYADFRLFFHRRETATADCPRPPPPDEMRDSPEINA